MSEATKKQLDKLTQFFRRFRDNHKYKLLKELKNSDNGRQRAGVMISEYCKRSKNG